MHELNWKILEFVICNVFLTDRKTSDKETQIKQYKWKYTDKQIKYRDADERTVHWEWVKTFKPTQINKHR